MTMSTNSDLKVISASGRISIEENSLIFRKGFKKYRLTPDDIIVIHAKNVDSITFDEVLFSITTSKYLFVIGESQDGFLQMSDFLKHSLSGFDDTWRAKLDGIYSDREIVLWNRDS